MRKVGEIWLGYSEFPGDFDKRTKKKKLRPFLVVKINTNPDIIRVVAASKTIKKKKYECIVKTRKNVYFFDKGDVYNSPTQTNKATQQQSNVVKRKPKRR